MNLADNNALQGGNSMSFMNFMQSANLSGDQASLMTKIANGDLGALSWAGWDTGHQAWQLQDRAGNWLMEKNGGQFIKKVQAYGLENSQYVNKLPTLLQGGLTTTPQQFLKNLGVKSDRFINAFTKGGWREVQLLQNQDQYDAQMASIGNAAAGVALQQQFYWGSGTYDNPGAGSMWDLENQQVALQRQSQRADFAEQQTRMQMGNRYAIARENNQWQRMQTTNSYNEWQTSFNYSQQLQQRQWTQQDWQYQDQTRALQWGWQSEDLDEAIRFSSGRERRKLIRQKDRANVSHNLEEQQIDTTRDRQEQVWKAEDTRYEKQTEYAANLKKLDEESFQLNKKQREETYRLDQQSWSRKKKEWEEQTKIEDEMRKLQRKFQKDQLDLQLASIGAQAEQITKQKELNDSITTTQQGLGDTIGAIAQLSQYKDSINIFNALGYAVEAADSVDHSKITGLQDMFEVIRGLNPIVLQRLIDIFEEVGG